MNLDACNKCPCRTCPKCSVYFGIKIYFSIHGVKYICLETFSSARLPQLPAFCYRSVSGASDKSGNEFNYMVMFPISKYDFFCKSIFMASGNSTRSRRKCDEIDICKLLFVTGWT